MSFAEIVGYIRRREYLEICCVAFIVFISVGILLGTGIILVGGVQMPHKILAAQADLNRESVPETVAVCDIQGVVLFKAAEVGVILIEFLLFIVAVVSLGERLTPSECCLESGFETRLGIRFPLVVQRKVHGLVCVERRLLLAGSVLTGLNLRVEAVLIPSEVAILTGEHQLMSAQFEGIIELCLSARMPAVTVLKTIVVTQGVEVRIVSEEIGVVADIISAQGSRFRSHTKARDAECGVFGQPEIKSGAEEHTVVASIVLSVTSKTRDLVRIRYLQGVFHSGTVKIDAFAVGATVRRMEAVTGIEIAIHRTGIEIDIKARICSGRHGPRFCQSIFNSGIHRAVITGLAVFFHNEVDNTCCTFR